MRKEQWWTNGMLNKGVCKCRKALPKNPVSPRHRFMLTVETFEKNLEMQR